MAGQRHVTITIDDTVASDLPSQPSGSSHGISWEQAADGFLQANTSLERLLMMRSRVTRTGRRSRWGRKLMREGATT
jgi:hypothetical protein